MISSALSKLTDRKDVACMTDLEYSSLVQCVKDIKKSVNGLNDLVVNVHIPLRETFINQQTDELASLIHTLYISGAQGVLLD